MRTIKFLILLVCLVEKIAALNELLDPAFGSSATPGFTATLSLLNPPSNVTSGTAPTALLLDDNKPLVGLTTTYGNALARYTTQGILDTTFNSGGSVPGITQQVLINNGIQGTLPFITSPLLASQLFIILTSNKRYRMMGNVIDRSGTAWLGGIQWLTNGLLDTEFTNTTFANIPGTTLLNAANSQFSNGTRYAISQVQENNSIVGATQITGTVTAGGVALTQSVLANITTSGTFNSTFGNNGTTIVTINSDLLASLSLCFTTTGKFCVLGFDTSQQSFFASRFTAAGILDTTFGTQGYALIPKVQTATIQTAANNTRLTNFIIPLAVSATTDPSLFIVGQQICTNNGTSSTVTELAELTPQGILAQNFVPSDSNVTTSSIPGTGILSLSNATSTFVQSVTPVAASLLGSLPDLVLTGSALINNVPTIFMYKMSSVSGKPITTFGVNGLVILDNIGIAGFLSQQTELTKVIRQDDGKFIVGGSALINGETYAFTLRITAQGGLDSTFNPQTTDRPWLHLTRYQTTITQLIDLVQQLDGKLLLALKLLPISTFGPTLTAQTALARLKVT